MYRFLGLKYLLYGLGSFEIVVGFHAGRPPWPVQSFPCSRGATNLATYGKLEKLSVGRYPRACSSTAPNGYAVGSSMFIPLHDSTPSTPLKSQLRVTTAAQVRGTNNLISHQCNQWSMVWPRPCRRLRLRLFRTHQSFVELSYPSPVVLQVQPGPNLPPHLRKTP